MKTHTIGLALAASVVLGGTSPALTPIKDNFNAPTLNPARWQVHNFNNGRLKHLDDRMHFIVSPFSTPFVEDHSSLVLLQSQSFGEDWQITLKVSNLVGAGTNAGVGLGISNSSDPNEAVFFKFFGHKKGKGGGFQISYFDSTGKLLKSRLINPKITTGSIRATYQRATQKFTFYFSLSESANPFTIWVKFGSFSVNGVGGNFRQHWLLDPLADRLVISLEAFGDQRVITRNKMTMDNFVLKGLN